MRINFQILEVKDFCNIWYMDNLFFRFYVVQLRFYRDYCDSILSEVELVLNYLQDLQQKYLLVFIKIGVFYEVCEQFFQDQVREKDINI